MLDKNHVGSVLTQSAAAGDSRGRLSLTSHKDAGTTERNMSRPEGLSGKSAKLPTFFVGKNSRRRWVVQDQQGLCRALFVKRAEAMRFAMYASGGRPRAVTIFPGVFELNMNEAQRT